MTEVNMSSFAMNCLSTERELVIAVLHHSVPDFSDALYTCQ